MDKEQKADLINKICMAQGEIQRVMIWLSRLHKDLDGLLKELVKQSDEGN